MKNWNNEELLHNLKNIIKNLNNSYQMQKAVFHSFFLL